MLEKENATATQSKPYRALKACDGSAPSPRQSALGTKGTICALTLRQEADTRNSEREERTPGAHRVLVGLP